MAQEDLVTRRIEIRGDELLPQVRSTDVRTGAQIDVAPSQLPLSGHLRERLNLLAHLQGRCAIGEIDQPPFVMELIRVADEMAVEHPDWEIEVTFPDDELHVWHSMIMNVTWKVRRPRAPWHKHSK